MAHQIFAAIFLVAPLVIYTNFAYPHSLPRWIVLTTLGFMWSLFLLYNHLTKPTQEKISRVDIAFFAFVAALFVTSLTGVDFVQSFWGMFERSFGVSLWITLFVCYVGLKKIAAEKNDRIDKLFITTIFLASAWGLAQKFLPGFAQTFSGERIGGTLGNAIFFGSYLSLGIGSILFILAQKKDSLTKSWNFFSYTTIVLAISALLFTQTRGPLLGFIVGSFVALVSFFYLKSQYKKQIILGALALSIIAVGFFARLSLTQTTAQTRFLNWTMAWNGFKERPVLGWGPENYRSIVDAHFIPKLSNFSLAETHPDKPHNYFLEILATSGLVGFSVYLIFLSTLVYSVVSLTRSGQLDSKSSAILFGILATSGAQNITAFETHGSVIVLLFIAHKISMLDSKIELKKIYATSFFCILALGSAYIFTQGTIPVLRDLPYFSAVKITPEKNNEVQNHLNKTPFELDYFTALSFKIVGQYWQNPDGYAKLTASEKNRHAEGLAWLSQTIPALREKHARSGAWGLQLAQSAYQISMLTQTPESHALAQNLYENFLVLAPNRQEPRLQLAQLALQKNELELAISWITEAINLDPSYPLPYWQRSIVYFAAKQPKNGWSDLEKLIALRFEFTNPTIANYMYNQLLSASMTAEAETFKTYFERGF